MPKLSQTQAHISRLKPKEAAAIVALIDLKTEDDMDRVLNKLDVMQNRLDARLGSLEKSVDARLTSLEKSVDARFNSLEKSVDARFNMLYWLIGLLMATVIAAAKFL